MSQLDRSSDWKLTTTATAATATVTQAAPPSGQVNYVTGISASVGAAVQALGLLVTLRDGATIIGNFHVNDQGPTMAREYASPVRCHGAVELQLAAGGAGVVGAVTLDGFTR